MKKFKLMMIATITSMLITSCGSDSGSGGSSNYTGWGSNGSGSVSSSIDSLHSGLANVFPCSTERVFTSYYVPSNYNNGYNNTTVSGNLTKGAQSGENGDYYAGANSFNDILIVAKTTSGSSVTGYNYYFSFCSRYFSDNYYGTGQYPLLTSGRGIAGIQMYSSTVLTATTNCPANIISSAQFYVGVPSYSSNNVSLGSTTLSISFAPPGCY